MRVNKFKAAVVGLACGVAPLITTATCDPYTGAFDLYRDDDFRYGGFFFDEFIVYDEHYVDDCSWWCW